MKNLYFGKIAVGKSTVIGKLHSEDFIDCDESIWEHYYGPNRTWVKSKFKEAIGSGDKDEYHYIMKLFVKDLDFNSVFSKDTNYEVSVFGNYYNQLLIPQCIVNRFNLIKISCSEEIRKRNIEKRKLEKSWVDQCDYMYEDPNIEFNTIYIEDL
jgi:hypothetical protein